MITGKINVEKIVKDKLFPGKKGTYLDIVLIETPDNEYGDDYMIVQSTAKGEESIILGNAKVFKRKSSTEPENAVETETPAPNANAEPEKSDGLPF